MVVHKNSPGMRVTENRPLCGGRGVAVFNEGLVSCPDCREILAERRKNS